MKKIILLILYIIVVMFVIIGALSIRSTIEADKVEEYIIQEATITSSLDISSNIEEGEDMNKVPDFHSSMSCDWNADDSYLLAKIAMAEAESENTEGKALVMMVVLNRVIDSRFPNTIKDVIYQKKQFTPVSNGRFDRVEPNADCWMALHMIMAEGWDESLGALYFASKKNTNSWHDNNLEYLFTYGNHKFYK